MQEDRSGSEQQPPEYPALDDQDASSPGAGGGADGGTDDQPTAAYPGTPPPPGAYGAGGEYGRPGSGYGAPGGYGTGGEYGGYGAGGGYGYPGAGHQGGGQAGGGGYPGGGYPGGYHGGGYPGGYPGGGYQGGGYQGGGYGYGGYPPGDPGYGMPGGYGTPPGGYGERPKRANRAITYVLVAALAAGVGAGTVLAMRHNSNNTQSFQLPGSNAGGQQGGGASNGGGASRSTTRAVSQAVSPGIVDVISTPSYQPGGTLEGTGMIVSSNGLVLTNNHVVEGTSHEIAKIANTGKQYRVTVLGTDATDDVALLKLDGASNLKTVPLGNSDSVRVGQTIVALGNAEGQDGAPTVVTGTITNLDRSIQASDAGAGTTENLHDMLQTNAPIVEGDSGGALASTQGKVIGMNTAANTGTTGAPGTSMGFAIPINRAMSIVHQIEAGQTTAKIQLGYPAFLGVTVASSKSGPSTSSNPRVQLQQLKSQANAGQSQGFGGLGGNGGGTGSHGCETSDQASAPSSAPNVSSGVLVGGVLCGTPVDAAGMTAGAVITAIDGHAITSPASLTKGLGSYRPGETVSVSWVARSGQHHTSSLKLAPGPAK